ncbi:hypothetical protein [Ilumatobacter coccineus]|jgi:hypothetical protein|uniref:Uncharacterized protein n=1 Tax=Ilumatobacter coccineus (strain NBRC 103263 / KCTC 29153 / YM16-304) TaxID=1313172 RepID=A0A6C7ECQ9_ILUCY|nr:hypothetical protein [Ilumatobacter coccineus]BAN04557.1 hypothetical protein YM304_42430 [Ilumatobacter coccineus YM16-304]
MTDFPIESGPVDAARLDANWTAITAELDAPQPSRIERLLRFARVPTRVTRLVVATPALRRAWYLAVAVVVFIGLAAIDPDEPRQSLFVLLVLAPLVPVLGVSMAYGPAADPAYEVQLATPMRGLRLIAMRAATVLGVSIAVIVPIALLGEVSRPMAAAWLLPAFAVTTGSLALMTFVPPRLATAIAGGAWVLAALIARGVSDDRLGAFTPIGQLVALAATIGFATLSTVRRASFDRLEYA